MTRITYTAQLGANTHPDEPKYVGAVLPGATGTIVGPYDNPGLEGWVITRPDEVRLHDAGSDPIDVAPTMNDADFIVICHPVHYEEIGP